MKKYLTNLALFVIVLFSANDLFSQEHVVKGQVIEQGSEITLPGVTVVEEGTTNGAITDMDGNYTITVKNPTGNLQITSIGYKKLVIPINNQTTINVELSQETIGVDEVVVIGYGTQKKKVVTGAIATVGADEINSTPVLRIEQAMQGRTAGVQVTNVSGQPGESLTVRIRGAGTTGDASPLYIVDGMQVDGIDYLNPGDIESIDVLKDAASAAIYGARAANGVVLITTKSGKKGKMTITYSGYYGIQNVQKTIDMLDADEYQMMMNEGAANAGQTEPFDLNQIQPHNTDWQDYLFQKNAPMTNHELNVSGGNDKSTYSSSLSFFSQEGIIGGEKSKFERITARLNATHQVNKFLKFGSNFAYSHIIKKGITSNGSFNTPYSGALNMDPLTPVFEENTTILAQYPYNFEPVVTNSAGKVYGISNYVGAEVVNPMALLEKQSGETRLDKFVGNGFLELEIVEGLKFKSSVGIDLAFVLWDAYNPLFYLNGAQLNDNKTSINKNIDRYFTWQSENTLNYTKKIADHNFSVLAGTSIRKWNKETLSGFNTLASENQPYLDMAKDTADIARGGADHEAWFSVFGRVLYDFRGKYAFTGIIRRDGSSKFGPNNRYGIFPSVGFSWAVSDEEFIPTPDFIDFLKLRLSWGINGNDKIGNWRYLSVMDNSRGYIFGGGRSIGISPKYIENADLRWEQSEQIDIALDLNAFSNRLSITADYYIKTTNDLLEVVPIPGHIGNDAPAANVGSVKNEGIELSIDWRHKFNEIKYSFGINAAYNKNVMTEISNPDGVLPGSSWAIAGMVTRSEEGLPIGYFYGYETNGIFQTQAEVYQHLGSTGELLQPNAVPGDVRFVNVNNDAVLDDEDRTMIGNPIPDFTFGINGSVEYKNFDFSFLMAGAIGNDVFNGIQRQDLQYTNQPASILDRWTPENPSTEMPRYTWADVNGNNRISDLYVEKASYLKVKNIQIGYTLPNSVLSKIGASNWRFYFSVENLLTLTKYSGADPEIGQISEVPNGEPSPFDTGIDRGIYPQARIFRIGTSLSF